VKRFVNGRLPGGLFTWPPRSPDPSLTDMFLHYHFSFAGRPPEPAISPYVVCRVLVAYLYTCEYRTFVTTLNFSVCAVGLRPVALRPLTSDAYAGLKDFQTVDSVGHATVCVAVTDVISKDSL
jgi:hypothetical protein